MSVDDKANAAAAPGNESRQPAGGRSTGPSERSYDLGRLDFWKENIAGFEGREVSCRTLGIFFEELPNKGQPPEFLAANTGYSLTHLQDINERISWDAYRAFMDNAGALWTDAELVELGKIFFRSPEASPMALVARLLYTPLEFYRIAARPGLRSGRHVNCIQPFIQELGGDKLLYTIKLHPDYKSCHGFWLITQGVLISMPTVMGLPPSEVEMLLEADGAQYLIQMPKGGGWLAWLRRWVTRPFTMRATARELEIANIELQQQYLRLQAQMAERVRAESAAAEARVFLMTAIENMRDGFVLIGADGRLLLCNKQYERMFPRVADRIKPGALFADLVEAAAKSGQIEVIKDRPGESFYDARLDAWQEGSVVQYRTSEGRWIEARDNILEGGGRIGIRVDITEKMAVAAELEELVAELEEKNNELERFTYTVSHDLKSPLVTVNGFLGLLQKDLAGGDSQRVAEDIAHIREATANMEMLLDDLLDLSRVGQVINTPERVGYDELVQEALQRVAGRIESSDVQISVMPDMPQVFVDRQRIVEVLQNLIDNAAKFKSDNNAPQIEIGHKEQAGETVFYVRDNGIGISARYHDKIFELFERLDPAIEGTGVGLTLVKRIIQAHNGRVWLESSENGGGTTFYFTLPDQ